MPDYKSDSFEPINDLKDDNTKDVNSRVQISPEVYQAGFQHSENLVEMILDDLKADIRKEFSELKGMVDNVKFTKKSTIIIIGISIISLLIQGIPLLLKFLSGK